MDDDQSTPPVKRRRTSPENLDHSSRASSPERNATHANREHQGSTKERDSRERSRERSNDKDKYRERSEQYDRRSQSGTPSRSSEYGTPRSRSRSRPRSYTHSFSRSPRAAQELASRSRLGFKPMVILRNAHARGITSVKFSPDSSLLATGSADSTINIYSVPQTFSPGQSLKPLRTLRGHMAGINALSWSPIGPPYTLASASDDKSMLLWSPLSSDLPIAPSPLTGHSNYVYSLAFSPKGNMLVSGSFDEAVFLWDVRSARVMRQLPAHSDPVSGVDFIRDGTMVCSCSSDGLIRIWDSGTGQCLKTIVDEDRKPVTAVRFSPNGRFVLAWTLDDSIRLWRYIGADTACVKTYQGHVNHQYSLSGAVGDYPLIDPETGMERREGFLVTGSEDGDLVCWDVSSKDLLWRGKGHRDVVLAVDFGRSNDGRGLLASVGKDRELRIWIEDAEPRPEMDIKQEDTRDEMQIDGHVVSLELKREDVDMENGQA